LIDPITGFRSFRLYGDEREPVLLSMIAEVSWTIKPGKTFVAECRPDAFDFSQFTLPDWHESPDSKCRCGLHVHYNAERCGGFLTTLVAAEGKVIPHTDGFRTERLTICALHDELDRPHARLLADMLEVPHCETRDQLEFLATRFGQPMPMHLRSIRAGPKQP
jgi:hypothetical protein